MSMLLVGNTLGMDAVEYWNTGRIVNLVSATETTLTLRLSDFHGFVNQFYTIPPLKKMISEYNENNEYLILSPERETVVGGTFEPSIYFIPILFKDQRKGFRIVDELHRHNHGITNTIMYVALGDTLTVMEEDDVEMIMERGKWKTVEEATPVRTFIPREELVAEAEERIRRQNTRMEAIKAGLPLPEEPQPVPEPEPSEETGEFPTHETEPSPPSTTTPETTPEQPSPVLITQTSQPSPEPEEGRDGSPSRPQHRLWLCAIPLLILAVGGILYFRHKK